VDDEDEDDAEDIDPAGDTVPLGPPPAPLPPRAPEDDCRLEIGRGAETEDDTNEPDAVDWPAID
jgi:hypothetical protein